MVYFMSGRRIHRTARKSERGRVYWRRRTTTMRCNDLKSSSSAIITIYKSSMSELGDTDCHRGMKNPKSSQFCCFSTAIIPTRSPRTAYWRIMSTNNYQDQVFTSSVSGTRCFIARYRCSLCQRLPLMREILTMDLDIDELSVSPLLRGRGALYLRHGPRFLQT